MLQQFTPSGARRRVATILAAAAAMAALAALAVTMLVPALADDGDPAAVGGNLGQRVAHCALQINSPWQGDPDIGQLEFWVTYKVEGYYGYYVAVDPAVVDTKISDFGGDNVDLDGDVTSISTRSATVDQRPVLQTDTYTHLWATKHKSDGTTDGADWTPPGLRTNADVGTLEQYGEWAAGGRYCDAHALSPQTYVPTVER
jgi:hypothetical protein